MTCRCCEDERRRKRQETFTRMGDDMRTSKWFGEIRERVAFVLAKRDPVSRRWFFFSRVKLIEKRGIGWVALSMGIGVMPHFQWEIQEICPR